VTTGDQEPLNWHAEAIILRSKLAELLGRECIGFVELERLYRVLEADRLEYDRFNDQEYKDPKILG